MRRIGVLAFLWSAACSGTTDTTTIANTHDACAPLALVSAAANDVQLEGMRAAESLWRDHGAPALGLFGDATVEVRFEAAAGAFHGIYEDQEGVIYINTDLAEPELSIVIAHEVGHVFGLVHIPVDDRVSLMNPGNLTSPPTADDQRAVAALWGTCN